MIKAKKKLYWVFQNLKLKGKKAKRDIQTDIHTDRLPLVVLSAAVAAKKSVSNYFKRIAKTFKLP